ncbi:MAG: HAD-IA family hydrolase [Acidobacteria bacterium]|nr:HAD-IA family hydrolase [Acidobacteriota bacterium]
MSRPFDVITFDCYGTLIDWESGIAGAFSRAGFREERDAVLAKHAQIEPVVEAETYRRYRDVLAETAARMAKAFGRETDGAFLAESLPQWQPFADTNEALERLANAGYRLGILSNVDDDLLAETREHFTVDFTFAITAQQVGSYKPAPGHFLAAREKIGDARWLHAAQSNFHDIVPTNTLNIPNAWINRKRETALPGGIPGRELANMAALADWLA